MRDEEKLDDHTFFLFIHPSALIPHPSERTPMPQKLFLTLRFALLTVLLILATASISLAQTTTARAKATDSQQVKTSLHLVWPSQPGVLRYRLQLALDEGFNNIVFDRAVFGTEYVVTDLNPGKYYWRFAPAVKETGTYSKPRLVEITGTPGTDTGEYTPVQPTPRPTPTATANDTGWRTTTGAVMQPLMAHLRSTTGFDIVGMNSDGMVYGLDGVNGSALWTARFRPNAKRGEPTGSGGSSTFTPILIDGRNGLTNVLVEFDGGVRAIEGATGRELWRTTLANRPVGGGVAQPVGGGAKTLLIASEKSNLLTVINPENGKVITETKLDAAPVTSAAPFPLNNGNAVVFALDGGELDVRAGTGERVRFIKMDTTITTPPLVVKSPRGSLVYVGTESGLITINAEDLKPIGRIATEGDAPSGILSSADLDADGTPEVVMLTRRGRIAVVGTTDGKIKWHSTGGTDAASASFADVDNDGVLDVIIAAGPDFARAFSGRDGSVIWRTAEDARGGAVDSTPTQSRALIVGRFGEGGMPLVVGTDIARTGLRAVSLPESSKATKE